MHWHPFDIRKIPVVFQLKSEDGRVLDELVWDKDARLYGAYVNPRRNVCEFRFEDAREACVREAIPRMLAHEIPDRFAHPKSKKGAEAEFSDSKNGDNGGQYGLF